jgi:hypothetical protein
MQTVFETTKEFELRVSFTDTDVSLVQECVALATTHQELSDCWIDAIALITTMMDAEQRALFRFDRLYPDAIEIAVFGGGVDDPIIIADEAD